MKRWSRLALAMYLLVASIALGQRSARADDVADEADLQFSLGAEAYQKQDYRGALEHFLASNRLVANGNVMFNVARTYERLHRYPDAFRWYVRSLEGERDAATRDRIEKALHDLAPNVAVLRVDTDPPGAKVYLDRKDLGERGDSPQRLGLAPGRYRVIADLPGYEDAESAPVDVQLGQEVHVALTLVRILGTVHVEEADGGQAQVHVDREDAPVACTTPCDVSVPPGPHTLFVARAGAQTATVAIEVPPRATLTVHPQVVPLTGTLVVDADERDAVIEIDGKPRGFTPAVLAVPVGAHRVRVSLKGFRTVERDATVAANETAKLDLELVSATQVEAASRAVEEVRDAPGSVSIVPYQELRAMRYPTVAEALRGARGVYTSDDRGYVELGFRGFGRPGDYGNRTLVLLDGQPMNDDWLWSSYVGYDLRTDLDDIERIEVVRGPGSVLYGTGAFSGVVNLVPRSTDEPSGAEVGLSTAGDGVARGRVRVQQRFGDHGGVWSSLAAGHGAGRDFFFPEYAADGPPAVAGWARGVDGFDVVTWTGQARWEFVKLQWSVNSHRKTLPTGEFDTILGDADTRQTDTRAMIEAKAEPKLGPMIQSTTRTYANYYGYRGNFAHLPENGGMERSTFDGQWVGAEQRFVFTPLAGLRLSAGGLVENHFGVHQYDAQEVGPPTVLIDDTRDFSLAAGYGVLDVAPAPWLKIEAGARYDAYSTFGHAFSPRGAIIVRPSERDNLKVLAGQAFRAPSAYETFYFSYQGQKKNLDLQPEHMASGEVEYSHAFTQTITGIVSVYENLITDLISLNSLTADPAGYQYQYQNTNSPVATAGLEAELRREWQGGWMLAASYSYQRSKYVASASLGDVIEQKPNPALREVPNAPEHLASLLGSVPISSRAFGGLSASSRLTFTSARFDRYDHASDPPQGHTEPALLWDIVLSGTESRWRVSYALGVYNAFDWRWSVPVSPEFRQTTIPQSGRTVLASAGISF
jgi:outer membrane receptor protein involved in Fe transport